MTNDEHKNNPMHGVKLKELLEALEARYGWELLGQLVHINCFNYDPSINSCLKFLRKTPWARTKVEALYIAMITKQNDEESNTP
ncbi:MAG: VF530 family protein [Sulfurovum sp.]|nr:VF530 family protein [Sulfurovum sp.]